MRNSGASYLGILMVAFWLALSGPARGQEFSEDGQKFWEKYKQAKELNDDKEIARLVRRSKTEAVEVVETLVLYFCSPEFEGFAEQTKMLAEDIADILKTDQYVNRFSLLLQLNREDRARWLGAWNKDVDGFATYLEGKNNENVYKLDEARQKLRECLADFAELKDQDLVAKATMHLAMCNVALGEHYEACVEYKNALDIMRALPFPHPDLKFVEVGYNDYISKGYDPTKPKNEGGEPPPEGAGTAESGAVTETGEVRDFKKAEFTPGEVSESAELKYTPMRNPDDFITPGYNTGYNPYLWPGSWFDAAQNEITRFNPYFGYGISFYGKQINISRVKNKFYFDIDANEKTQEEIKPVTKPYKLVLTDAEKGPDGKPPKYQLFVQATGQQEVMFNIEQNNAPETIEAISLRVRTGCYTKGKVLGENFTLIDDNSSGVFGDHYDIASDFITYGEYRHWRPDAVMIGRDKIARPFSKVLRIEDKFYETTVDPYGINLDVKEVKVETGTLRFVYNGDLEPTYVALRLIDERNPGVFFNVADAKDPVVLPIGEYEIACGKIEEKKKKNAKQIRIYHGKADFIKVWPGEETVLELGAPFTFTFETRYVGKDFIVEGKTVNVWGKYGELYTQFFDEVPQPLVSIRDKKTGKMVVRNEKMRLAERDDFYKDRYCCWHPLDFTCEVRKDQELEARLEAKKVELLGGPIESEWH